MNLVNKMKKGYMGKHFLQLRVLFNTRIYPIQMCFSEVENRMIFKNQTIEKGFIKLVVDAKIKTTKN